MANWNCKLKFFSNSWNYLKSWGTSPFRNRKGGIWILGTSKEYVLPAVLGVGEQKEREENTANFSNLNEIKNTNSITKHTTLGLQYFPHPKCWQKHKPQIHLKMYVLKHQRL